MHFGGAPFHFGGTPKHFGGTPKHFGGTPKHFGGAPFDIGDAPFENDEGRRVRPLLVACLQTIEKQILAMARWDRCDPSSVIRT